MISAFDRLEPDFYVTYGSLKPADPSYVYRPADEEALRSILAGDYTYVLTSRQMGKSSLMQRTAVRLRESGINPVLVDLTRIGSNVTADQWYFGLLTMIGSQLSLKAEMTGHWDELANHSPLSRFIQAITEIALARTPGPISIFIDEIDSVRALPFSTDEFFAAIRSCYNRRASEPELQRLNFCLLGVATPADLIRNVATTPFNIGRRIELTDFTTDEALPLAAGLHPDPEIARRKLKRILDWTGGHPNLTQKLCQAVARQPDAGLDDVDRICNELFLVSRARTSDDNLLFVHNTLRDEQHDSAAVIGRYRKVLGGPAVVNDPADPVAAQLRLAGVVRVVDGQLRLRNRIYTKVFDKRWVADNMPDADLRREREAYLRGVLRTAAVAAVILLIITLLAADALYQQSKAIRNAKEARVQAAQAFDAEIRAQDNAKKELEAEKKAKTEASLAAAANHVALLREQTAEQQQTIANRQTVIARAQKRSAQAATAAEQIALDAKNSLVSVANLQLAGQIWDSESGPALSVDELLTGKGVSSSSLTRQRFEWGYQWNLLHNGAVASMVVSASQGNSIPAVVSANGCLEAIDTRMRFFRLRLADNTVSVQDLRATMPDLIAADLSSDGSQLVGEESDGHVEIRETSTLRKLVGWTVRSSNVEAVQFLSDQRAVVTYRPGCDAECWNTATGKLISRIRARGDYAQRRSRRFAWTTGMKYMAMGDQEFNSIALEEIDPTHQAGHDLPEVEIGSYTRSLAFSTNKAILAVGTDTGDVRILSMSKPSVKYQFPASGSPITAVAYSPDGSLFATGASDGLIRIWDANTFSPVKELKGHMQSILNLSFSQDDDWIASSDRGGEVRAWNLNGVEPPTVRVGAGVVGLAVSPDSKTLVVTNADGTMDFLDARSRTRQRLPGFLDSGIRTGDKQLFLGMAFANNNEQIAVSGMVARHGQPSRYVLQFWDRRKSRPTVEWDSPPLPSNVRFSTDPDAGPGGPAVLAFSPDGRELAGGFRRSTRYRESGHLGIVKVWDAASGRVLRALAGFDNNITSVCYSPDGHLLLVACDDRTLHLYNAHSGVPIRSLSEAGAISSAVFSPNGHVLAAADLNGRIELWDTRSWQSLHVLVCRAPIFGLTCSPDGLTIASANGNRTVSLWDIGTGRLMRTLAGHTGHVHRVAFSPNGSFLVSADADGIIKLWRLASFTQVQAWEQLRKANDATAVTSYHSWISTDEGQSSHSELLAQVSQRRVPGYSGTDPKSNLLGGAFPSAIPMNLEPLPPTSALAHGSYGWFSAAVNGARMTIASEGADTALRCHISNAGQRDDDAAAWRLFPSLERGRPYILQFRARASRQWPVYFRVTSSDLDNFDGLGLEDVLPLSQQWRAFRYYFRASESDSDFDNLEFKLGNQTGDVQIADTVLVPDVSAGASGANPQPADLAKQEAAWGTEAHAGINRRDPITPGVLLNAGDFWHCWAQNADAYWYLDKDLIAFHVSRIGAVIGDVQADHDGLPLAPGKRYVLSFRARADKSWPIQILAQHDASPFEVVGLQETCIASQQWRQFRYSFLSTADAPNHSEINFFVGSELGTVEIADVVLSEENRPRLMENLIDAGDSWGYINVNSYASCSLANGCITARVNQVGPLIWNVQAYRPGLPLESGRHYTLSFQARADKSWPILVMTSHDQSPYECIGLYESCTLSPQWRQFRYSFQITNVPPNEGEVTFSLDSEIGTVQIADVVLTEDH